MKKKFVKRAEVKVLSSSKRAGKGKVTAASSSKDRAPTAKGKKRIQGTLKLGSKPK